MKLDPNRSPLYVVLFGAGVSGLFTAAIMGLHAATESTVEANERLLTEKALVDLFGLDRRTGRDVRDMSREEISSLVRRRIAGYGAPGDDPQADRRRRPIRLRDPSTGREIPILVAYGADLPAGTEPDIRDADSIVGYALPISGAGFWARIEGWLAVDRRCQRTLGIVFLKHAETPGLGGRITEPEFREQFRPAKRPGRNGLKITPPPEGTKLIRIERQKPDPSDPAYDRHVDAITGATGTSKAVERFLIEDLRAFQRAAKAAGLADDE